MVTEAAFKGLKNDQKVLNKGPLKLYFENTSKFKLFKQNIIYVLNELFKKTCTYIFKFKDEKSKAVKFQRYKITKKAGKFLF